MDDRKLHALIVILKCGSLRSASEQLCCTQSAVTQMINSIENELGIKIFNRTNKGVALTQQGKNIFPYIKETDTCMMRLKNQAQKLSAEKTASLKLGTHSSISTAWLADVIYKFRQKNPNITINISIGTSDLGVRLRNRNLDMAIGDKIFFDGFQWFDIMDDPIYAVIPAGLDNSKHESISREELNKFMVIRSPINPLFNMLYEKNSFQEPFDHEMEINTDDDTALLRMVATGIGATALPKLSIQHVPADVHTKILEPPAMRKIGIALPEHPIKAAREFANFLLEEIRGIS